MRPGKNIDRADRVKSVERQFLVAKRTLESFEVALKTRSDLLTAISLNAADLWAFKSELTDTYFIRLFAEFETAIKDYWKNGMKHEPTTRIMDVIDSLAANRKVPDSVRVNVHAARKWRNKLVHEGEADASAVELTVARGSFCKFLGFLPPDW